MVNTKSDSRKKNTIRNAISSTFNRIVGLLIPFFLRTAVIYVLGEQYLGLNNLFQSILQVLSLADLGFNAAIVYSMYQPISDGNVSEICALLHIYKKIYTTIGCIVLIAGLILLPFLDYFIAGECPADINISIVYLIYLANTVMSYLCFADRKALFTAHQRSDIENNINSFVQILFDVCRLIVLFILKNYYFYIFFLPATTFISGLICYILSYRMYPNYISKGDLDKRARQKIFKRVVALSIQKLGNTISTSLDNIVVSSFLGLAAVAVYGNYFYIVSSLMAFIGGGIAAATASIGNSLITETREENYAVFKKINMINQWALTWSIPCVLCLYQHFMLLWVGTSLMADMAFVCLMVLYFYLGQTRKVVLVFKDAAGMWWADKWKPLFGCLVNLLFNLILVRFIGMHGVIFSTIISYLLVEIPWETYIFFKCFFPGKLIDYVRDISQFFTAIVLSSIVSFYLTDLIGTNSVCSFFIKAGLCFIIGNFIFSLMFHKKTEYREWIKIISVLWRKNERL